MHKQMTNYLKFDVPNPSKEDRKIYAAKRKGSSSDECVDRDDHNNNKRIKVRQTRITSWRLISHKSIILDVICQTHTNILTAHMSHIFSILCKVLCVTYILNVRLRLGQCQL